MKSIYVSIAAAGLLAPALSAQCDLVNSVHPLAGNLFNHTLERVADVTGDGIPEIAVGDPRGGAGSITIYSGASGASVLSIPAPAGAAFFGCTVASIGDLNGDGKSELATSTANTTSFPQGAVFVYSLTAPATPFMTMTDVNVAWFGRQVAAAGDVDGDGKPDILVAATHVALQGGEIQIRSGATGSTIRTLQSGPLNEAGGINSEFGIGLAGGTDVTGDGVPDVVVGAPFFKPTGSIIGRVKVYSGATGATVRSELGTAAFANFGADVAFVPDYDNDGVADIAIGSVLSFDAVAPTQGGVRIESGATGAVLRVHAGLTSVSRLGYSIRSLGDVDGDGVGDYGSTGIAYSCHNCSSPAIAWSGATGAEIVALSSHITDTSTPADEYFLGIAPLADLNGDGAAEVVVLSQNNPFAPTTTARLSVLRANGGTLNQAAMQDGCSGASPFVRPSLVVSGCLESGGAVQLDAFNFIQAPLLFVSTTTGFVPLPGGCALTVGAPAIVVPMPFNLQQSFAGLTAHISNLGGPLTLYLQAIGKQTSPGTDYAATGRSTLTLP